MSKDTKTIHEFLADNPNVDVSEAWRTCWQGLSHIYDRIASRFPHLSRHASTLERDYYQSPSKEWEGSFAAYTGQGMEWLVHSWLGSRKNSILDMNVTAFLGQETNAPHLVIVFGTIPKLYCYCDLIPRSNLLIDDDYLDRYYSETLNQKYLAMRGHENFQWAVSHGTYMRAMASPFAISMTADLNEENIAIAQAYYESIVDEWLASIDDAPLVDEKEQAMLRDYDHKVRQLAYQRDPMNALAENIFGTEEVARMVAMRMGQAQMLDKA